MLPRRKEGGVGERKEKGGREAEGKGRKGGRKEKGTGGWGGRRGTKKCFYLNIRVKKVMQILKNEFVFTEI